MKPLFLCRALCVTAVVLFCAAFTTVQSPSHLNKSTSYYWYLTDNDTFDKFGTPGAEAIRLEDSLGVPVDNNPFGGTEVSDGYTDNAYPHDEWPAAILYAHY